MNKNSKIFAVGDIHGRFDLLTSLYETLSKEENLNLLEDTLIFIGDYIDRGSESEKCVNFVSDLKNNYKNNVILLKGNHELMAEEYFECNPKSPLKMELYESWLINGGSETLNSYMTDNRCKDLLLPFIKSLELYYETDSYIFVHGGIPLGQTLSNTAPDVLLWNRSLEYDGNKVQIVGHSIKNEVIYVNRTLCIDTGAFSKGKLSCVVFDNDSDMIDVIEATA